MLPISTLLVVIQPQSPPTTLQQALGWAAVLKARLEVLLLHPIEEESEVSLAAHPWLASVLAEAACDLGQPQVVPSLESTETIVQEAARLKADLLLIDLQEGCTHLKSLLRQLPCPVLLVKQNQLPRCFAAAIGVGSEDSSHRQLNQAALSRLVQLADRFQSEMRVLSALPNPAELVPLMGDVYAASYIGTDLEASYRQSLEESLRQHGLSSGLLRMAPGRPDVVLPELVQREIVDCLLIGTVARKGFAAFWLGNTAEDVLPHIGCDVLLLRPQDDESAVAE